MSALVVIIRPSFKRFCGDDACRAALFNHFLYWIAQKAKGEPAEQVSKGEVYWYGTAEEICEGMDRSWCVNKVRKEIKELVTAGLIGQRRNPKKGWDQTRHYFISVEQGEVLKAMCEKHEVCLKHLGLSADILHLLYLVNATTNEGKCNCQIREPHLQNMVAPNTNDGSAIPKVETKVSSKVTSKEREILATLSSQQQCIFALVCKQRYIERPKLNDDNKEIIIGYLDDLIEYEVNKAEQLRELHELALKDLTTRNRPNKTVYLGNIANMLEEWKLNNTPWNAEASIPEPEPVEEQVNLPEKTLSDCVDKVVELASQEDSENIEWYIDWVLHIWKLAQERGANTGGLYDAIFRARETVDKRYKKLTGQAKMDAFMGEVENLMGVVLVAVEEYA